ncbi:hypothetical protein E2C01_052002 [Portunus trituberculatus]|uniref:Uncharacterized protein n=1 Tax=Portunus trituberculatus TaxID=210409 RepID=A0A5B7GCH2_PORTR|nr:hypothetical protein [Portunus trituberculatus]
MGQLAKLDRRASRGVLQVSRADQELWEVESDTSLFADDAKILKQVNENEHCDLLQENLDKIYR